MIPQKRKMHLQQLLRRLQIELDDLEQGGHHRQAAHGQVPAEGIELKATGMN